MLLQSEVLKEWGARLRIIDLNRARRKRGS
jgi:hypothetical protein